MTFKEFLPYNNRLVKFTTRSGTVSAGMFMDCLGEDKLFPEDVMFVSNADISIFKKMCGNSPRTSTQWKNAVKAYATRVDLNDFERMMLVDGTKDHLIAKWKHILLNDKKFLAYLKLEEIQFVDHIRVIPAIYGDMRIAMNRQRTDGRLITTYEIAHGLPPQISPLTQEEFEELYELFEKQRIFG